MTTTDSIKDYINIITQTPICSDDLKKSLTEKMGREITDQEFNQALALARCLGLLQQTKPLTHAEKQANALKANSDRQTYWEREIRALKAELALKKPGTIRHLKSLIKDAEETLRCIKVERGCLFNGGVW